VKPKPAVTPPNKSHDEFVRKGNSPHWFCFVVECLQCGKFFRLKWPTGVEKFEETDYSFQTHPQISLELGSANGGIECLFVKYWPKLRDSGVAVNKAWLNDMVSALVIMRNEDGSAWRVAAVFIKLESWVAADPQPAVVNLC